VFGSGATSERIPHGKQADQFKYYAKWGMSFVQALQTAYLPAAQMLNYGWENQIGAIEKGKFADIIAVSGNLIADVTEMERVKFVMNGWRDRPDSLVTASQDGPSFRKRQERLEKRDASESCGA
jgi:imidazolonepropionase-like amidohydrolase